MGRMLIKLSILWVAIALVQMHGYEGCLEKERIALLEIKAFFKSISNWDYGILTSWVDNRMSNCCGWERVKCNATTGRVIELSLSYTWRYNFESFTGFPILDLSLFHHFDELQSLDLSDNSFGSWNENKDGYGNLTQLEKLDLSYNNFNNSLFSYLSGLTSLRTLILQSTWVKGIKFEQGLKKLKNLEILDLSWNSFNGSLSWLGLQNLKNLKILNLEHNEVNGSLSWLGICELENLVELNLMESEIHGDLPHCLGNLTHLRVLDLSSNQLSGSFSSVIATLTSLEYLSLSYNNFEGLFSFSSLANLSKLEVFVLSPQYNLLQVETENQLPAVNQLKVLTLANCNLHGRISGFLLNQYNLRLIDVSHNKLVENFPTWLLQNNTKLQTMFLRNNSFSGILQLPSSEHGLVHLDISNNNFISQLPENMGKILPRLNLLNMSENSFEGHIPSSMGEMKSLYFLDMSSNSFSGELPSYFASGCFSLRYLILSDNKFQGQILPKYMNWTQLTSLYLDNNQFSGELGDGLLTATYLSVLDISNNKIQGQVPQWIGNFSALESLLMQKNFLEGNAIIQLRNLETLHILDISENRLSGPITSSFNLSSINLLYMQKNALNGSIPNSFFKSSTLTILDLRDNEFSGSIPQGINDHSNLNIVLLGGNHLQGHIPNQLCRLKKLNILDLSHNRLSGSIPTCFANMLFWKVGIENDEEDRYYESNYGGIGIISIGFFYNSTLHLEEHTNSINFFSRQAEVELVIKNRYDFYKGKVLDYMTGLYLSSNELNGIIPSEIGDLQGIYALNLSNNSFSGLIPKSFSNLKQIESLDLSYNKLIGQIPPQLTELYYLEIFNVSYNNLSGSIPYKSQFGTFDENTYVGNPHLCGPPIKKMCTSTLEPPISSSTEAEEEEGDSAIDMVAFYWSFAASYVTIILVSIVILWMNSHWCKLWFCFIDKCISFGF